MPDFANLSHWRCWVFDCDGVLLDSNRIKAQAMYNAALEYGPEPAVRLVEHHEARGGIGREHKFRWFLADHLGYHGEELDQRFDRLMQAYSQGVLAASATVAEAPGLRNLLHDLREAGVVRLVVSGGEQSEVRRILAARGLLELFDGVFGSPDDKLDIVQREIDSGRLPMPALFLGDARYDSEVARAKGLDFVFLSAWTDFVEWEEYCAQLGVPVFEDLQSLHSRLS